MNEVELIKERYQRRKEKGLDRLYPRFSLFQHYSRLDREYYFDHFLHKRFSDLTKVRFLEVGAGEGANLPGFLRSGIRRSNLFANELLEDRSDRLKELLPSENVHHGDAREIPWDGFDVIFQSMLFSSVLDFKFRAELAKILWRKLKPGGLFLWYDLAYDNPRNPDVRGIGKAEIRALFPEGYCEIRRCTIFPPLGRRIGHLYPYLNFPFLRGHLAAAIGRP